MIRLFDILFSVIALIALSPLLVVVIMILKFTGEGEIFYIQQRVGMNGDMFGLFKFATMMKNSPNIGTGDVTLKKDPRVLPFGNILRKSKINEIPQLLNIIKNDMSIIGPRPQTERCFLAFSKKSQNAITSVKPGLSGIGSIIFRNEEDYLDNFKTDRLKYYDEVIAPYKGKLEEWYIENKNIYTYFMLIILTFLSIFTADTKVVFQIFKNLPPLPEKLIIDKK